MLTVLCLSITVSTAADMRVALIGTTGEANVVSAAELADLPLAAYTHAWIWDDARPPAKVAIEDVRSGAYQKALDPAKTGVAITIRLSRRDKTTRELFSGTAVVAPAEMWNEIPENDLPRFPVDPAGVAHATATRGIVQRIRFIGIGEATWWQELRAPGNVTIRPLPTRTKSVAVTDSKGQPLREAVVTLIPSSASRGKVAAMLRADERGRLDLQLPDGDLTVIVSASGYAPAAINARASDLPAMVRLDRGMDIRGRVLTQDDKPVAGASIRAEAWVGGSSALFSRSATSTDDGSWSVRGVPLGEAKILFNAPSYVPSSTFISEPEALLDVGDMRLTKGSSAVLRLVDASDGRTPVARAKVAVLDAGDRELLSNERGEVVVRDIDSAAPPRISASARGFITETRNLQISREPQIVEMTRGVVLRGRFIHETGSPVAAASIRIESGNRFSTESVAEDGTFELVLQPDVPYDLQLEAFTVATTSISIPARKSGETVDLGDVRARSGVTVRGVVVDESGQPLPAVRIWMPRPASEGAIVSWMNGRLIETTSDEAGLFELRGLTAVPALLRFDHPEKARAYVAIAPERAEEVIEDRRIVMNEGATVSVLASGADDALTVTLDLRGNWQEIDWRTAPARNGVATFLHVPAGHSTIHVRKSGNVVCQRDVDIAREKPEIEVECASDPVRVSGMVTSGDKPVSTGSLVWLMQTGQPTEGAILNSYSPGGLRQQHVYGAGAPRISIPLSPDGTYRTDDVFPGRWNVSWVSEDGSSTPARSVEVPDAKTFLYSVALSDGRVRGEVLDENRQPVPRARLRELNSRTSAIAGADGRFELNGLPPGANRIQAFLGDRDSAVASVTLEEGRDADPIVLTLDDTDDALQITVVGSDRSPVRQGGFVFLETADDLQMTMTDAQGIASFRPPDNAARFRAAAYVDGSIAFSPWQDKTRSEVMITVPASGRMEVISKQRGLLQINGPDGWNVSLLFSRLGNLPRSGPEATVIAGLPPGTYALSLGDAQTTARVESGKTIPVKFE
jgi:hypothetical protein